MSSFWGRNFRIATFGESHGQALGVVVEGVPAGMEIDQNFIQQELDLRKPGSSDLVSARKEDDRVEIISGILAGRTLGSPITMLIRNQDQKSEDYQKIKDLFRPGHADFTYFKKYGQPIPPGGGRASGRETVARVAAGAVAKLMLKKSNIDISGYVRAIGNIVAENTDLAFAKKDPLRFVDQSRVKEAISLIESVRKEGDSIGGLVEVIIQNLEPGLGDPCFYKLDALLAWAMLSIGGVKGIEFGDGFRLSKMKGSEANDQMSSQGFLSNRTGGILGGISTGQPILLKIAVKPTPSIAKPQRTIDVFGQEKEIKISGRHDPCLCPRIVPVAEAMAAIVIADAIL